VNCTLADWAKYVSLHLEGERCANGEAPCPEVGGALKLLKPETYAKLHAPGKSSDAQDTTKYAMGWSLAEREWARGPVLTHNGSNTMWFCVTWIAPEADFAVLVATNQGGDQAAKGCDEAAWAIIQDHLRASKEARGDAGKDKTDGKR
jgi:CubicO group peptidase (beta-lactamase class C family)